MPSLQSSPPHVQRMIEEADQLKDRMDKLLTFLGTDTFRQLPNLDQDLLRIQLRTMKAYALVLRVRIDRAAEV